MRNTELFLAAIAAIMFSAVSCSKISSETSMVEMSESIGNLISGTLVSSTPVEEVVKSALQEIEDKAGEYTSFEEIGVDKFLDEIDLSKYGINLECYRIKYWSKDNFGNDIELNGDIAFIDNPFNKGTRYLESVSLFHTALYTRSDKSTNYESTIFPIRAIHNALVVHPLYQGSWCDKGEHDILVAEPLVKARQAIDCERAALQFIKQKEGVEMMPCYYTENISFSVGANTALATHYLLEQDEEYSKINAKEIHLLSSCLSEGCYSFYSILPVFLSDDYQSEGGVSSVKAYSLIATIVGSYDTWKGVDKGDGTKFYEGYKIEDFFSSKFLNTEAIYQGVSQGKSLIEFYRDGDMSHFKDWYYENLSPANMLAPSMYGESGTSINEDAPKSKALIEALKQNDVILSGWSPKADVCFFHSLNDELIPYKHVFESYMSLSHNGLNPNVRICTVVGLNHDDSNFLWAAKNYLVQKHPVH